MFSVSNGLGACHLGDCQSESIIRSASRESARVLSSLIDTSDWDTKKSLRKSTKSRFRKGRKVTGLIQNAATCKTAPWIVSGLLEWMSCKTRCHDRPTNESHGRTLTYNQHRPRQAFQLTRKLWRKWFTCFRAKIGLVRAVSESW